MLAAPLCSLSQSATRKGVGKEAAPTAAGSRGRKGSRFRHLGLLVRILVSGGAIAWLVSTIHWGAFVREAADINWPMAAAAFVASVACFLPVSLRWRLIARACGYPMSVTESIRWYLVGSFFNSFLPTGMGGDVARGVLAARRHGFSVAGVLGTILAERVMGLAVTICLVMSVGWAVVSRVEALRSVLMSMSILTTLLAAAVLVYLTPALRRPVVRLVQRFPARRVRTVADEVLRALNTWLANQLMVILAGFLIAAAIPGFHAPWFGFFIVIPLVFIVVLLPSIGGYGVREAGFAAFFGWFGVTGEAGALFAMLHLLLRWVSSTVGAIIFVLSKSGARADKATPAGLQ